MSLNWGSFALESVSHLGLILYCIRLNLDITDILGYYYLGDVDRDVPFYLFERDDGKGKKFYLVNAYFGNIAVRKDRNPVPPEIYAPDDGYKE